VVTVVLRCSLRFGIADSERACSLRFGIAEGSYIFPKVGQG
jgi:hypothetical protein